jgi:glycosyltransferase involved in cell wall biosynthesis
MGDHVSTLDEAEGMQVDVVLRTHNRQDLLPEAVASFFAADRSGMAARLLVVDNASSDGTARLIANLADRHGPDLVALYEPRPGGQHALNRAIASSAAEVVAFFDDDERIAAGWLQTIRREFADPATDYIAGPVKPLTAEAFPPWLPAGFGGVLGIIDSGDQRRRFGDGFAGMLTQGNCAVRRAIFALVGPYPDELPTAEDRWLYQWLEGNGRQGFYCPDMVVGHIMQPERMSRDYFRRWAAREGRDLAVCDRLAGRPSLYAQRWYWRSIAQSLLGLASPLRTPAERFKDELTLRVALAYARAGASGES